MAVDPKGLAVGIAQVALRVVGQAGAADMLGDVAGIPRRTPEVLAYERFLGAIETSIANLRRGAVTSHPSESEEIDAVLEQVRVRFEALLTGPGSVVAMAHLEPGEFRALVHSESARERAQFGGIGPRVYEDALTHLTEAFISFAPSLPQFANVMLTVIANGVADVAGGIGRLEANDSRVEGKLDSVLSGLGGRSLAGQVVVGVIPSRAVGYVDREVSVTLQARVGAGGASTLVSLAGLRGAGKSQVAADVAHGCREEGWSVVAWVNADSRDNALADLGELADRLGATVEGRPPEAGVRRLYDLWASNPAPRRLLVLDNVVDRHHLEGLLPPEGVASVVVTTADRSLVLGEVLDVGVFTVDQARDYLEDRLHIDDLTGATDVGEVLGRLPLALAGAAWTIGRRRNVNPSYGYDQYVQEVARQPLDRLLGSDKAVPEYPRAVVAALKLAVESALDAAADRVLTQQVLGALAFLDPSGVPRQWLEIVADAFEVEDALITIADSSLAQPSDDAASFIMHRLVARVVRDLATAGGWGQMAIATAARMLAAVRPLERDGYWAQRTEASTLVAHVRELLPHTTLPEDRDAVLSAGGWSGHALREVGAPYDAIAILRPVLEITEADFGVDDPATMSSRNDLAGAYESAGDLGRAIPLYEQALSDRERVLGPDHPSTLSSRNNLAFAYQSAGDLGRAIPLYEQALTDLERVLGPDHPDTLTSRDNLAFVLGAAGDLGRAIPLHEQALSDLVRVLGPDHPSTLSSRNNLAYAYQARGDLGRAIPLAERNLTDSERVLGPDHPNTLTSRNNLAYAYMSVGDLDRAIPLFEENLSDRVRVLGPNHPETLASRNNLASAYEAAGDLGRAVPLYEWTLADSEQVLGPDHPNVLTSRHNLAYAYELAGDLRRAIPLFEQNLTDRERVLGPDHPDTLFGRNNLACAHRAAGDLGRAIPLFEQNLTDGERVLGPDNPNTLSLRSSLAEAYISAGDPGRAIPLFEQNLTDRERVLGPDHPVTLTSRNNLAYAYELVGDLGRAVPLFEQTLTDSGRVLGPDDPDTLTSRSNLAYAYKLVGDLGRAIALFEENLSDRVRVLGPDHPRTLSSREDLALSLAYKRDPRARALAEFNIAESLRLFGAADASTLDRRDTLAHVLLDLGNLDEGTALLTTLLADCKRVLGDHPVTGAVERRLAKVTGH